MAITIGNKPGSDFSDPIGMLADCHRRIEKFLDILLTVADEMQGRALNEPQHAAIETALRYFREAAPKHTADEEESLFPRMRASQHDEAKDLLSNLDHLHTDHVAADQNHRAVDELFRQWLADRFLSAPDFNHLSSLLHSLRDTYTRHIKEEETRVFLNATKILTPAELRDVGLEMAKRRGLAGLCLESQKNAVGNDQYH